MTGNMSYLTDFEEIDKGYAAFGGNPKEGKITGIGRNDNGAGLGRGDHPPSPNPISKPRPKLALIPNGDLIGALYWGEMLSQTRSDPRWRSYRGDFTSALLYQIHN
ncbi:hypothetical protein Tco_1168126, partial [Tanacetum coccineum]